MQLQKQNENLLLILFSFDGERSKHVIILFYPFLSNYVYVAQGFVCIITNKKSTQFQYLELKFVFTAILITVGVGAVFPLPPPPLIPVT